MNVIIVVYIFISIAFAAYTFGYSFQTKTPNFVFSYKRMWLPYLIVISVGFGIFWPIAFFFGMGTYFAVQNKKREKIESIFGDMRKKFDD